MNQTKLRLIPALVAIAFSGSAAAAGFQLLEQNASGLGNSYAGSAAVADNASTIFFNPAGMTQLQDREVSAGLAIIDTQYQFTNTSSSTGVLSGNSDGGATGFVPNAYLSWRLSKDIYVGLGIGAPFGLMSKYDNPWYGAAQSVKFDIQTININPSIAWRANEWLSIGGGVNYQQLKAEYERALTVTSTAAAATTATLNLDGSAWGWNVGALFTITPATKLGLSYRSTTEYDLDGDFEFSGPLAQISGAPLFGATVNRSAKASITLPDTWILSATHKLNDRVELLGDVSWTGWSSIPKVDVINAQTTGLGAVDGNIAQTLDTDFRDTWRVAFGANYQLNDAWKLKAGIAYDQTPVKGVTTRLVSLPDNDRTWFSIGAQWKPSKTTTLDLGAAYLLVKDTEIDNNQTSAGRGRVTGEYDNQAFLIGAQFSMAF
ncbi:MAG: long-chain fatty acid transporter [Betaproteobacteria bacterium HGW-Betaproteobacteria-6]|jgi:long-chain fatty acid transport protein|nr:MAG: long-chain fatty acid transporter [Betaproteobacteria bacterium HGW-Betaproteobacteria-6]